MRLLEYENIDILDIKDFEQIGSKKGSNNGGLFKNKKTNEKFYIKFSKSSSHAKNEVLASRLYKLMGSRVPDLYLIELENGNYGVGSKWVHDLNYFDRNKKEHLDQIHNDFITHVWLANWDNIGTDYENQMIDQSGKNITIDVGGALLYRAKGDPKGKFFNDEPTEHKTLRNMNMNRQASLIYGNISDQKIKDGIKKLKQIDDSILKDIIIKYGPGSMNDKNNLANILIKRKYYLIKEFS